MSNNLQMKRRWVNVPSSFGARLCLSRPERWTPPWFAGIITSGVSFRTNSIVILCNIKLGKLSLINCDGNQPHLICNEINAYSLFTGAFNDIQIIVFARDKFDRFHDALRGKSLHPDIKVTFITIDDQITAIGIKNNMKSLQNLESQNFSAFCMETPPNLVCCHPNEWKFRCWSYIAILICIQDVHNTVIPCIIFDGQNWTNIKGWNLPKVKTFVKCLPLNVSMLQCLEKAHCRAQLHKNGMISIIPRESLISLVKKQIDGNKDSQIERDIHNHVQYDLHLASAANSAQIIKNQMDIFRVIKNNASFVINIMKHKIVDAINNINEQHINSKIYGFLFDVGLNKDVAKQIENYCTIIIAICANNAMTEETKAAELLEIYNKSTLHPYFGYFASIEVFTDFAMLFEEHLKYYIHFQANKQQQKTMKRETKAGIKCFKRKQLLVAVDHFIIAYQMAQFSKNSGSNEYIIALFNLGTTYHEIWKMKTIETLGQARKHAIMYLKSALYNGTKLKTQKRDKRNVLLMEKIKIRLISLGVSSDDLRLELYTHQCVNKKCQKFISSDLRRTICSGCRFIRYCSRRCQKWHWKFVHRFVCTK
eukprot:455962_1